MSNEDIAFVIMAFGHEDTDDLYKLVFEPVCRRFKLEPYRVDLHEGGMGITQSILDSIRESRLILADLTYERPNCYAEVGYALGQGKHTSTIITARRDHDPRALGRREDQPKVHFDLDQYFILYWDYDNLAALEKELIKKVDYRLARLILPAENMPIQDALTHKTAFNNAWVSDVRESFFELSSQFNTWFQLEIALEVKKKIDLKDLLDVARQATHSRIGFAIGSVRSGSEAKPKFLADSIVAHAGFMDTRNSWALKTNGDFCSIADFPELRHTNGEVNCQTRIFHLFDSLAYCERLYNTLKIADNAPIHIRYMYNGLKDRRLYTGDFMFFLDGNYVCIVDAFSVPRQGDHVITLRELREGIVELAVLHGNDFFIMFDGLEIPNQTYERIWQSYRTGN